VAPVAAGGFGVAGGCARVEGIHPFSHSDRFPTISVPPEAGGTVRVVRIPRHSGQGQRESWRILTRRARVPDGYELGKGSL